MPWFFYALFFALTTSITLSLTKKLTKTIDVLPLNALIYLANIPLITLMLFLLGGIPNFSNSFIVLILIATALDFIAGNLSTYSIKFAPVSLISPISSFHPFFTTLLAIFFLNETPTLTKFLGVMLIVIGTYLLNVSQFHEGLLQPIKTIFSNRGVQLALACNFIWAVTPLFQKPAIFETNPISPMFLPFIAVWSVSIFQFPFLIKGWSKVKNLIKPNMKYLLLIGLINPLGVYGAFMAFSLTNVGYATAIFKLSIIFNILSGAYIFKEENISERLLGATVMIAGTVLLVL